MLFGCLNWHIADVALINEGNLNLLSRHFLHRCRQLAHLSPIVSIGWCHQQNQQMSQRINRNMHLASFAPFGSIIAAIASTFRRRLQGPAVEKGSTGLSFATLDAAQQQAQVVDYDLETAYRQPVLGLLIDNIPGRQVVQQHPPSGSGSHNPLNTSLRSSCRYLASSGTKVKYGTTNSHSSFGTSLGYGFLVILRHSTMHFLLSP